MATAKVPKVQNASAGRKIANDYNKQFGHPCEDCDERESARRIRCQHCGLLICRWCFGHTHGRGTSERILLR